MYVKTISNKIQEKLKARERALSWKSSSTNQSALPEGALKPSDIQSRTTFVRMCSNKLYASNIVISGGEMDDLDGTVKFGLGKNSLFQQSFFGLYTNEKDRSGKEYGARPISGIKSIEVAYKGSYKAIREATVNWVVSSITDLDRLTPYFLTVGKTVALDWGWVNSNANSYAELFDGQDPFITFDEIEGFKVKQEIFNNPQFKIQSSGGDYDALGGKISNFETTLRQDGGFDCVTTITAVGSVLFQKPIDKPANQIQIESTEKNKDDKKPKKLMHDSDNIINAIINLKGIILTNSFGVAEDKISDAYKDLLGTKIKGLEGHLYHKKYYGFAVDSVNNPNVLWMNRNKKMQDSNLMADTANKFTGKVANQEDIFVKWGWFEDWLLNRYVSLKGGEENEIKMTFRSIDTVLDENNLPIELTDDKARELGKGDDTITYSNGIYEDTVTGEIGTNTYVVKGGDSLSKIARKLRVDINELVRVNLETLMPDVYSGSDQAAENADNLLYDFPEDVVDDMDLDGTAFPDIENTYIPRSEYGYLNLQPNQVLIYTPIRDTDNDNQETLDNDDKTEEFDEKTSFRGLQNLKERGNFLKTPTLIKNAKSFLKPKNPFKFFSTELLPTMSEISSEFLSKVDTRPLTKQFIQNLKNLSNSEFTKPGKETMGRLRYMWVNIREIQTAFGVTFNTENSTKPTNVNPPGTLENGIKNLLNQLNRNFYDFWNFELTVDPYDPSNVKVIDKKAVDISDDNIKYTEFEPNSHKVSKPGIYKFPSFKVGSIVKNQSLAFKIPDAMAITILYGSNKSDSKTESHNEHNNPEIMKLFATDGRAENSNENVWSDRYLDGITSSNIGSGERISFVKVGSENVNHNSKIVENQGLNIQPKRWWSKWTGDNNVQEPTDLGKFDVPQTKFQIINDNLVFLEETHGFGILSHQEKQKFIRTESAVFEETSMPAIYEINDNDEVIIKPEVEKVLRNRLHGGEIIDGVDSIKVDTIIPAQLTLEVDGIGGIVPGDICQTEYILPKYNINFMKDDINYGPFTYFLVTGISQKVDSTGWTTELTTQMKINHIPDVQGLKTEEVESERSDIQDPPEKFNNPLPTLLDEEPPEDLDLEEIELDDYENWNTPLPVPEVNPAITKILDTGITNIADKSRAFGVGTFEEWQKSENDRINIGNYKHHFPKISGGKIRLSSTTMEGSTRSNLQLGNQGFKLNKEAYEASPTRPYIPVPTRDEEFEPENLNLEEIKLDDYENWDEPPQGPIRRNTTDGPVEKREVIEKKDPKKQKTGRKQRGKTTYKGNGYTWYDEYIYRENPSLRPVRRLKDGTKVSWRWDPASNRGNYDRTKDFLPYKKAEGDSHYAGAGYVLRNAWNNDVEGPRESGITQMRSDMRSRTIRQTYDSDTLTGYRGY